jgi:uracil-DNA glycosylase
MAENLSSLLSDVRACRLCEGLPLGPNPILQASASSRILIAGQAPGRITHAKGIPFDDPSGNRLRDWLGVTREQFYDPELFAIIPMGFCFPGTAKSGDLPPRPLCAETWRSKLLSSLPKIKLTVVIGQYAQIWHMPEQQALNLTERVRAATDDASTIPLPHPSPRNGMWLKQNLWFEKTMLPNLKLRVKAALQ